MTERCFVCGKAGADMEVVPIAVGWRHCCQELYPPLYPPRVPAVPYGERAADLQECTTNLAVDY